MGRESMGLSYEISLSPITLAPEFTEPKKRNVLDMIYKYKPKNRIEFLEIIERMLERKYENVNINLKKDGLVVEYDSEMNGKHQACFIPYPEFR
jgi:hypothetical protein